MQFFLTELGTVGSLDGNERFLIRARLQPIQIENVLRKYIVEYVQCKLCRSAETVLKKENRLFFVECGSCKSQYSVAAIKSGYVAQTGRRAAQRTA